MIFPNLQVRSPPSTFTRDTHTASIADHEAISVTHQLASVTSEMLRRGKPAAWMNCTLWYCIKHNRFHCSGLSYGSAVLTAFIYKWCPAPFTDALQHLPLSPSLYLTVGMYLFNVYFYLYFIGPYFCMHGACTDLEIFRKLLIAILIKLFLKIVG